MVRFRRQILARDRTSRVGCATLCQVCGRGKSFGKSYSRRKPIPTCSLLRPTPTLPTPTPEAPVDPQPQLSAEDLLGQLRSRFEKLCQDVADAVNQAPAGQVLNASDDKVRDLFADFRQATYQ